MGYEYEGDYVCHHCHLIYCAYASNLRCDLCSRKLRWANAERIKELEVIWSRQEHRKGLSPDFAYHRQGIVERISRAILGGELV